VDNLIERIKDRDSLVFRQLVAKHQRLLYSIVLSNVNAEAADDIVQMTWERAIAKIHQLKDQDKFTPWLCRICRNILIEALRQNNPDSEDFDDSLFTGWQEREKIYEEYDGLVRMAIVMLPEEQRKVVQLRFFTGLSYQEISLVCNIEEKLVKSRLYEAKKSLRRHLSTLYNGLEISQKKLNQIEEWVMNEFEKATLGASVFSRLSLDTQKHFVYCVRDNSGLSKEILEEIGKVREGSGFIEEFHTKIMLPELISILSACDRYTETRLINDLEISSPSTAELVKQNMFVFEDVVILSRATRERLYKRVKPEIFKKAMSIVSQNVKKIIISDLPADERAKWCQDMGELDTDLEAVKLAQLEVVSHLRQMDLDNEVEIVGMPELPE